MCMFCVGLVLVIVLEIVLQLKKRDFDKHNQQRIKGNPGRVEVQVVEPMSPPNVSGSVLKEQQIFQSRNVQFH